MNLQFRDVKYTVPFLVQLWLFATPIAYPSSLLHEPWRSVYAINPMVGVVEGFRWALLGTTAPGPMILVSAAMALAVLAGWRRPLVTAEIFKRTQRTAPRCWM
jgi:lipopolysaccharide transport system permease protein